MSDLVERLRRWAEIAATTETATLCEEAAREVERLRAELIEARRPKSLFEQMQPARKEIERS